MVLVRKWLRLQERASQLQHPPQRGTSHFKDCSGWNSHTRWRAGQVTFRMAPKLETPETEDRA